MTRAKCPICGRRYCKLEACVEETIRRMDEDDQKTLERDAEAEKAAQAEHFMEEVLLRLSKLEKHVDYLLSRTHYNRYEG